MLETSAPSSPFVADMSMRIGRHAATYAESITEFLAQPHGLRRRAGEEPLLDLFTRHAEAVLATYDPPGVRRAGDSLVFQHLYQPILPATAAAKPPTVDTLLGALIAAEVEFRGPLRLSRTQNRQLADYFERLAPKLVTAGLPAHAALAYQRAISLYRLDEDTDAEDRCGLARARARRLAQPVVWRRVGGLVPDLLCGYGYRPFRMLWWIALQLVVFTLAIAIGAHQPVAFTTYQVLVNYLNPLGVGDTQEMWEGARPLFVVECYLGSVTMSVFFALLVRRWFRL